MKKSQPLEEAQNSHTAPKEKKEKKKENWNSYPRSPIMSESKEEAEAAKKRFWERMKKEKEEEEARKANMSEDEKKQREIMDSIENKLHKMAKDLFEIEEYVGNYKDNYYIPETKEKWEWLYDRIEKALDALA